MPVMFCALDGTSVARALEGTRDVARILFGSRCLVGRTPRAANYWLRGAHPYARDGRRVAGIRGNKPGDGNYHGMDPRISLEMGQESWAIQGFAPVEVDRNYFILPLPYSPTFDSAIRAPVGPVDSLDVNRVRRGVGNGNCSSSGGGEMPESICRSAS